MENASMPATPEVSNRGKGALDAFLNLLSLITVGWLAESFGTVCFQLINKYLGELGSYASSPQYYSGFLKYGIASLIVIAPAYFIAINILHSKYKKNELNHGSGIYKWLTYLMLLISSLSIIGALITLITNFLDGNYTLPFILKVLTVIIIAGVIFGYYFYDLRRKDYSKKDKVSVIVGAVVAVAVIAAVVGGFLSVETPMQARAISQDENTKQVLNQAYYSVNSYYGSNQKLQDSVDIQTLLVGSNLSARGVSYRKVSDQEYELCADFKANDSNQFYGDKSVPWFNHQSGRQCYTINAQKEYDKTYKVIQTAPAEVPAATAPAVK